MTFRFRLFGFGVWRVCTGGGFPVTRTSTMLAAISLGLFASAGFPAAGQTNIALTGIVRDGRGVPAPRQFVEVYDPFGPFSTTVETDASGGFAVDVPEGSYRVRVQSVNDQTPLALPYFYDLLLSLEVMTPQTVDITIPAVPVGVFVRDTSGNPLAGIGIAVTAMLDGGPCYAVAPSLTGCGYSNYEFRASIGPGAPQVGVSTDGAGWAQLWLFPVGGNSTYSFTAVVPPGMPYTSVTEHGVRVAGMEVVHLALPSATVPSPVSGVVTTTPGVPVSGQLRADGPTAGFAIETQPAGGTVILDDAATGAFTYTPHGGTYGYDSFTFSAVGGYASATQMVFVVAAAPQWPGQTVIASRRPGGVPTGDHSFDSSLSADGRFVAFGSRDAGLVAGDTNGADDIFVLDRVTGSIERVSLASNGSQANGSSGLPVISADGRFVLFFSLASNLTDGDGNGTGDVFVRDRVAGTTTLVSVALGGGAGNKQSGGAAYGWGGISADGRFVHFASDATDLVPGDTNGVRDVFLRDLETGITECLSAGLSGAGGDGHSKAGGLSADGGVAVFSSLAGNLVVADADAHEDVFVWTRASSAVQRISATPAGDDADGNSGVPRISADGRTAVFVSAASNLVDGDTNGVTDIFVAEAPFTNLRRVNLAPSDVQANAPSGTFTAQPPAISADGRFVAFTSEATNLVDGDTNAVADLFIAETENGDVRRVSVSFDGVQANAQIIRPSLSADGRLVSFDTNATTLVAGDANVRLDVFVTGGVAVSPAALLIPAGGGVEGVTVTFAYPGTPWGASTTESWLVIGSPTNPSGSGTVSVTAEANPGPARTTTITVAGQPVVVTQLAHADTAPPVIHAVAASPATLWPPNHQLVPVTFTVSFTDDDAAASCAIATVASSEPENGTGDGDTSPDWLLPAGLSVQLRAERAGKGSGRIYSVTVDCADTAGNRSQGTATVTVPHAMGGSRR